MAEAYFAFRDISGKEFVFQLTDSGKIEHARKILKGEETQETHVMGRLRKTRASYNPNWSFHLDPDTIQFFAMAIEVCDANIQYVEDHLDEACGAFLPGCHWCPWTSSLTREVTATGEAVAAGAAIRKIAEGWSGLKGTVFASGIDAACAVPDSTTDLYLFKGDQYARYRTSEEKITSGPKAIATGWSGLKGTVFASGIDAACAVPGSTTDLYLFKGDQYARYRTSEEKITSGPKAIATGWPGLKNTAFASGINGACGAPDGAVGLYLFKGGQYLHYRTGDEKIETGPKAISEKWALADGFSKGIDASCLVPGSSTDLYFFRGDAYERVH
ncbi:hemopexin repeat-containing protein [Actinocorallia aurantiaca]|uniref:BP74 N-terminal domain-containing protein n=1 Tax=Actinocorallia aurantiaca TaxID=46204 RepID=A0ABP6GLL1_9ACTN